MVKFDFTERNGGKFNQDRFKGDIFGGRYAVCLKRRPSKAKIVNFK
ncbi:hypothetical protein CAMSH0001_1812 [Campylobacter showae RM3277]|uniref:Uncharacterized protein n=1 Tax=Campylobacter showae RM3277 TaxID=553219 RepID=C6RD96_9BACT|nr:hypothetical protein CAMSH0001_1812 [Campylobacter showae RM3277]